MRRFSAFFCVSVLLFCSGISKVYTNNRLCDTKAALLLRCTQGQLMWVFGSGIHQVYARGS